MNTQITTAAAMNDFRSGLERMQSQFAMTLPAHIPAERFGRVVLNAVNRTPRLLLCDRQSLWNACMQASEDGLLPDKREGAIVPFKKGKDDDDGSPGQAGDYVAVWIPMVHGVRKLIRNSGEIRDLNCQLVYVDEMQAGKFIFELGDSPMLKHQRMPFAGDPARRPVYAAYSLAWDKDGNLFVPEVMFENEIMAVAARSKAFKSGPWSDPLFALEMRKKTVTKRHFKQLPTSRDLDRVLRRDDALYDFAGDEAKARERLNVIRGGAATALAHFGANKVDTPPADDPPADDPPPAAEAAGTKKTKATTKTADTPAPAADKPASTEPAKETPPAATKHPDSADAENEADYESRFMDWLSTATTEGAIDAKWKRERDHRNKINMTPERRDRMDAARKAKAEQLRGSAPQ